MVLFDDDNELSDDEIRKLLKRGLKKKDELEVNVAQDFFGLGEKPSRESESPEETVVEKSREMMLPEKKFSALTGSRVRFEGPEAGLEQKDLMPKADKKSLMEIKEVDLETKTESMDIPVKAEREALTSSSKDVSTQSVDQLDHDELTLVKDDGPTRASPVLDSDAILDSKEPHEEVMEEQALGVTSSETSLKEDDSLTTIDDDVASDATLVEEKEYSVQPSTHQEQQESIAQIKELQLAVRTLYRLVESLMVHASMLSGDKQLLPEVISKILVDLSEWNDVDRYPEISALYTQLSRLRSRIRQLPDQSLITEMVQEILKVQLEKISQKSSGVSSLATTSSRSSIPSPDKSSEEPSPPDVMMKVSETSILDDEIQIGQFQRASRAKDYWSYIMSSGQLMESYQHISDIIIPLYWRYALIEIHRYRIDDSLLLRHVIKIPAEVLNDIIRKLLREAPTSRLLQRIKQKGLTDQLLSEFLPNELRDASLFMKIRESVERYLEYFTNLQKGILSYGDVKELGEQSLKSFELGSNEIETRIPLVALNVLRDLREHLPKDDEVGEHSLENERFLEATCGYLTIYLVNELNRHFINERKFYRLLERLKRS